MRSHAQTIAAQKQKELNLEQDKQIKEYKEKFEQQTQDYHYDMRNKHMELVMLQARYDDLERENKELRKRQLEYVMEIAELKDMVLDNGGDYTENKKNTGEDE